MNKYWKNTLNNRVSEVCLKCKGKYFRGTKEGANSAEVVAEFGKCAAECIPSLSSNLATCPYHPDSFVGIGT